MCINCHLHSGLDGVGNRNHDVVQIMDKFVYKKEKAKPVPKTKKPAKGQIVPAPQVEEKVILPPQDILLFMGDLNYRINGYKPSILTAME